MRLVDGCHPSARVRVRGGETGWRAGPPGTMIIAVTLHENEVPTDPAVVGALLAEQCPQWAGLPLTRAGAGTDNTMYRLGGDLLVRLPRTEDNAAALAKEREWLPRLAPLLGHRIPEPVYAGAPAGAFPLPWSVYRWIDGEEVRTDAALDWAAFGADLAGFVRALHGVDLMGATRSGELSWYRGGSLRDCETWAADYFAECEGGGYEDIDLGALRGLWREGADLPDPSGPHVWLHGDLKITNLLVADGRLHAVIDFGCLSVGFPDAEHAAVWDLPPVAREAYRDALGIDDATWTRARAWAVFVGVAGLAYYRDTFPAFVAECRARLLAILGDAARR